MVFKGLIAATASVALMVTPAVASAQSSAQAARASSTVVVPSDETVDEGSELRGGFIIPLIALIAVILGLCVATDICGGDDEDLPTSP